MFLQEAASCRTNSPQKHDGDVTERKHARCVSQPCGGSSSGSCTDVRYMKHFSAALRSKTSSTEEMLNNCSHKIKMNYAIIVKTYLTKIPDKIFRVTPFNKRLHFLAPHRINPALQTRPDTFYFFSATLNSCEHFLCNVRRRILEAARRQLLEMKPNCNCLAFTRVSYVTFNIQNRAESVNIKPEEKQSGGMTRKSL